MKQRHSECVLASYCNALGADYETLSDTFREICGHSWGEAIELGAHTAEWTSFLSHYFNVSPLIEFSCKSATNISAITGDASSIESQLRGRGILVIFSKTFRHAMAYHNGLVTDSMRDITQSYAETMAHYHECRVEQIVPFPNDGETRAIGEG